MGLDNEDLTKIKANQSSMMEALLAITEELIMRARWTSDNAYELVEAMGEGYTDTN